MTNRLNRLIDSINLELIELINHSNLIELINQFNQIKILHCIYKLEVEVEEAQKRGGREESVSNAAVSSPRGRCSELIATMQLLAKAAKHIIGLATD